MASEKQQTHGASPSVADSSLRVGVRLDLLPKHPRITFFALPCMLPSERRKFGGCRLPFFLALFPCPPAGFPAGGEHVGGMPSAGLPPPG